MRDETPFNVDILQENVPDFCCRHIHQMALFGSALWEDSSLGR